MKKTDRYLEPNKGIVNTLMTAEESRKLHWKIPMYPSFEGKKSSIKANRYLLIQSLILENMISRGEFTKAISKFVWILRCSRCYHVYAFHKWMPGWYFNLKYKEVTNLFKKYENISRELPLNVPMKRIYIPKQNGKMRPLGIPDKAHKVLNAGFAEIIYLVTEHMMGKFQHGFRKNLGTQTAWLEIIRRTRNAPNLKMYEFDLKSFFNKVNPLFIYELLLPIDKKLANYVSLVNTRTFPKFKNGIEYENEFQMTLISKAVSWLTGKVESTNRDLLFKRSGLPQGLPWSPILCSLVLEKIGLNKGNSIMYADDGILFYTKRRPKLDISKFKHKVGIHLALEKSRKVTETLKFLGLELNLKTRILSDGKNQAHVDKDDYEKLITIISKKYSGPTVKNWKWEVEGSSWLVTRYKNYDRSYILKKGLFRIGQLLSSLLDDWNIKTTPASLFPNWITKSTRIEEGTLHDYQTASSYACNDLLKLPRIKPGRTLNRWDGRMEYIPHSIVFRNAMAFTTQRYLWNRTRFWNFFDQFNY